MLRSATLPLFSEPRTGVRASSLLFKRMIVETAAVRRLRIVNVLHTGIGATPGVDLFLQLPHKTAPTTERGFVLDEQLHLHAMTFRTSPNLLLINSGPDIITLQAALPQISGFRLTLCLVPMHVIPCLKLLKPATTWLSRPYRCSLDVARHPSKAKNGRISKPNF